MRNEKRLGLLIIYQTILLTYFQITFRHYYYASVYFDTRGQSSVKRTVIVKTQHEPAIEAADRGRG